MNAADRATLARLQVAINRARAAGDTAEVRKLEQIHEALNCAIARGSR